MHSESGAGSTPSHQYTSLDVLECPRCGGQMRPIAQIEDPVIARKILKHLGLPAEELACAPARGPPEVDEDERPSLVDDEWM